MYASDIVRRAWRSLSSARLRTLLTAFAIAVGAFALTLTLAASNGTHNYADTIVKDNFDPSELIVSADDNLFSAADTSRPQEYSATSTSVLSQSGLPRQITSLNDNDVASLKRITGVQSVRTTSTLAILYATRDGQRKYAATVQPYSSYKQPALLAGHVAADGPDDRSVIIPEGFVQAFGFSGPRQAVGKTVRLAVRQKPDQAAVLRSLAAGNQTTLPAGSGAAQTIEKDFTVIAVSKKPSVLVQPGVALYLTLSPAAVSQLADITTKGTDSFHTYLSVTVKVAGGNDTAKLTAVQDRIKARGYGAQSVLDTQKTITQVITVLQGIVLVFGLIAVIASVFGVVNTMYISVLQRTREIGLMKALGMHKSGITGLFLLEAGLLGLLGGALGAAGALAAGIGLNPLISRQLGLGQDRLLDFHYGQIGLLIAGLAAVAMLAGALPARKAARLDPIEALRTE